MVFVRPLARFLCLLTVMAAMGCSESPAHPRELEAVEGFAHRLHATLQAIDEDPSLTWEEAAEEHDLLRGWEDPTPTGSMSEGFGYDNETFTFVSTLFEVHRRNGSLAGLSFRSSKSTDEAHVIAELPHGKQLRIDLAETVDGWRMSRVDPIFEVDLVADQSAEDFVESLLARIFEIESAFLAREVEMTGPRYFYMNVSGKSQERLLRSVWHQRVQAELDQEGFLPDVLAVRLQSFLGYHHRALITDSETVLRFFPVEQEGDGQVSIRADLSYMIDGRRHPRWESVRFVLERVDGVWTLLRLEQIYVPAIFEFHHDGKGNWTLDPPNED